MITGFALCPQPPLLLRELNGGHDSVAALRETCEMAVDELVGSAPEDLAVVTPAGPLSGRIAERLLSGRWQGKTVWHVLAQDAPREECVALGEELAGRDGRTGLLVLADGSACRGEKAPGYVDSRAHDFDAGLTSAVEDGDWQALCDLDAGLAAELLVQGRTAFQVLGAAMRHASGARADLRYADDPFGVLYLVATWNRPREQKR